MKRAIVFLILASGVGAQTANVIELTPADQARAQKAWDALQKAKSEWHSVQESVANKYLTDPQSIVCQGAACGGRIYSTFESGFEFSKDFRFIVPKHAEPVNNQFHYDHYDHTPVCTLPTFGGSCQ
jgi:hypothetical protein